MIKDIEGLLNKVCNEIKQQTDIAVIGLSGGADSTLVSILCVKALGKENVYGIHMPYDEIDYTTFNTRSNKLANTLGIKHYPIGIGLAVNILTGLIQTKIGIISKLNKGNMRSRARMIVLYTVCCQIAQQSNKKVRVVGTGNLSEDYIGFDTKGGDALTDFFPIGTLVKSEVYQLLNYFRDQKIIDESLIDRVPSAGLWDGQTDVGELGYSYDQMESHVLHQMKGGKENEEDPISQFVWKRHITNKHKHEAAYVVDLREFCEDI